jgi:hypothetical protein
VSAMVGDKAPGLDGFFYGLLQRVLGCFEGGHYGGVFEKSLNASFISLIPKVSGAIALKDFRLISLVGGIYKIIAKVLSK